MSTRAASTSRTPVAKFSPVELPSAHTVLMAGKESKGKLRKTEGQVQNLQGKLSNAQGQKGVAQGKLAASRTQKAAMTKKLGEAKTLLAKTQQNLMASSHEKKPSFYKNAVSITRCSSGLVIPGVQRMDEIHG